MVDNVNSEEESWSVRKIYARILENFSPPYNIGKNNNN